jgi:hypothetical protein
MNVSLTNGADTGVVHTRSHRGAYLFSSTSVQDYGVADHSEVIVNALCVRQVLRYFGIGDRGSMIATEMSCCIDLFWGQRPGLNST